MEEKLLRFGILNGKPAVVRFYVNWDLVLPCRYGAQVSYADVTLSERTVEVGVDNCETYEGAYNAVLDYLRDNDGYLLELVDSKEGRWQIEPIPFLPA